MNIVILAASAPESYENTLPFYLLEEKGVSHIELLYNLASELNANKVLYIFSSRDIKKYCLDSIMRLFGANASCVAVQDNTAGAACSALLAIEHINNDEELLILNANELLGFDFNTVISAFRERCYDAGVAVFSSLNPQYSYVRLDAHNEVIEAAEKRVISRNATAGFYWYRQGNTFVALTMKMILKSACTSDMFYICPVFNELILQNGRIGAWKFPTEQYKPIKNIRQLAKTEYM